MATPAFVPPGMQVISCNSVYEHEGFAPPSLPRHNVMLTLQVGMSLVLRGLDPYQPV